MRGVFKHQVFGGLEGRGGSRRRHFSHHFYRFRQAPQATGWNTETFGAGRASAGSRIGCNLPFPHLKIELLELEVDLQ